MALTWLPVEMLSQNHDSTCAFRSRVIHAEEPCPENICASAEQPWQKSLDIPCTQRLMVHSSQNLEQEI